MLKKALIIPFLLLFIISTKAQKGATYGIKVGILLNSATLPNVKLNTSISSILEGDDIAKGVAQYADLTPNYQIGGYIKYDDGFGFSMLETNYTATKIHKEFTLNTGIFDDISLITLDRSFAYLDLALSYNIYLTAKKNAYFILGGEPSFLLSNTGAEKPTKTDIRAFTGFGVKLSKSAFVSVKAELGLSEVYKGSYIHHIMIPISLGINL